MEQNITKIEQVACNVVAFFEAPCQVLSHKFFDLQCLINEIFLKGFYKICVLFVNSYSLHDLLFL